MHVVIVGDKCCGEKEHRDSKEGFPGEGWRRGWQYKNRMVKDGLGE